MRLFYLLVPIMLLSLSFADEVTEEDVPDNTTPKTVMSSLAESLEKSRKYFTAQEEAMRKQYWERTLQDIRDLHGVTLGGRNASDEEESSSARPGGTFFSQWKVLSSDKTRRRRERRFEGFLSWDRLLQDWADDVQDYIEQAQAEFRDYPFSTYGQPMNKAEDETESKDNEQVDASQSKQEHDVGIAAAVVEEETPSEVTTKKATLLTPAPAKPGEPVLPTTDIGDLSKRLLIVTTASLPWRTGTAVNPLLRAAYLTNGRKQAGGSVTLMLPWLERQIDQERVYGKENAFETQEDQEAFVRTWLRDSAGMAEAAEELKITWYTAWQSKVENSIYSMGDITALIPDGEVDICILEEPEHLNWYRAPGESWTKKFKHVVGILHTNYFQYAMDQPAALIRAPAMRLLCSWMCRAHCHRVIKLSGTLGQVAPEKELVENVHGVRGTFIDVGKDVAKRIRNENDPVFGAKAEPSIYFIGKLLWSKGLGSLMELLKFAEETADLKVRIDMYGSGPDQKAAEAQSQKLGLDMPFHGPLDHAELAFTHKIFVNPSTSEVLCTTSAEALAMGKFVIIPSHPSNDFFAQFPNCLTYATKEEFVAYLCYALTHSPEPLTREYAHALSWEAATERLIAAGAIPVAEAERMAEATSSEEAAIEIALPPLVENEEDRMVLVMTFRNTRDRYRQFRDRLSEEIRHSKVLPKPLRDRLVTELSRRLDLDVDEFLSSPKLRLKLSPAELDKSLLELHDRISESPSGDLLRLIGGGGAIGLQNLYMRRQAQKKLRRKGGTLDIFPPFLDPLLDETEVEGNNSSARQRIRWAMRKNLPKKRSNTGDKPSVAANSPTDLSMSLATGANVPAFRPTEWSGLRAPKAFVSQVRSRSLSMSLLI